MKQQTFFNSDNVNQPLADRLRPQNLDEFVGQSHLLEREILSDNIARSRLPFEEWIVRYKQDWQSGCYEAMGIGVAKSEKG